MVERTTHLRGALRSALAALLSVALVTQGVPTSALAEMVPDQPAQEQEAAPAEVATAEKQGSVLVDDAAPSDAAEAEVTDEAAPAEDAPAATDATAEPASDAEPVEAAQDGTEPAGEQVADASKPAADAAEEAETTYPAIVHQASSNGLVVGINAPEGAFPAGTEVQVRPASTEAFLAAAADLVEGEATDARAVDISFVRDGVELEPTNGVAVSVTLRASEAVEGDEFVAVHVADDGTAEVVDEDATPDAARFEATEFSVYGIVGGSVARGDDEAHQRIEVRFRNGSADGAILSTQIVRAGDALVAPDPTPTESGKTFFGWQANSTAFKDDYLSSILTEDDIQAIIDTYGAKSEDGYTNLWGLDVVATYGTGYYARFHMDGYVSGASDTIVGTLVSGSDKKVSLMDILFLIPRKNASGNDLVGWTMFKGQTADKNVGLYDTVELDGDTDFHARYGGGVWLELYLDPAPHLDNVFAALVSDQSNEYTLSYASLPTDTVQDPTFNPGYTFDGWYLDSDLTQKIDKDATVKSDQKTIFAKWVPHTNVTYTIAYLAEDASGEPGAGNYYTYRTETKTGTAGEAIPESEYSGESIAYHHYPESDEAHYADNQKPVTIAGDGSTIKLVYYNSNRIKLVCTPSFGAYSGQQILPDKYVKPGEAISTWLSNADDKAKFDEYVRIGDPDKGETRKRYVEGNGYSFTGKQTVIDYVANNSADKSTVTLTASDNVVKSTVIAKFYYEAIEGEQEGTVTINLDGQNHSFVLDHEERWGSAGDYSQPPEEHFGYVYDNGGLTEWAYRGSTTSTQNGGAGAVRLIPSDHVGNPRTISGNYRYEKYYYDHYFLRSYNPLKFSNLEGVKANKPQDADAVMYGKKLAGYLPTYDEATTRVYNGVTYTFAGWYTNQTAANNPDDDSSAAFRLADDATMPNETLTLYAGWRDRTYDVTFDAKGGTIKDDEGKASDKYTIKVTSGKLVSIDQLPGQPERDGEYIFRGWFMDEDYTQPFDYLTYAVRSDTTVYAAWSDGKTCMITYHKANGDKLDSGDTYLEFSVVNLRSAPEDKSVTDKFLGWGTRKGDKTSLVPNTYVIANDVKLYALYGDAEDKDNLTVVLHANYPGSTEADDQTKTMTVNPDLTNGQVTLPDINDETYGFDTYNGYRFIGWSEDKDWNEDSNSDDRVYTANAKVGVDFGDDGRTDLYAIWEQMPERGSLHQVIVDSNYGGAKVAQSDEDIANAVTFTNDEELSLMEGEDIDFYIIVTDASDSLGEDTKGALHAVMDEGYEAGAYLDVTAWLQVGTGAPRQLSELDNALTVTLSLPDALKADGRTFEVARRHAGAVARVSSTYANGALAFDSDRFSDFEIAYEDVVAGTLRQEIKADNYGGAKVAQSDEDIAKAVTLTEDEIALMAAGSDAVFWIQAADVSSSLDTKTKSALNAALDKDYKAGVYLDVTAWVKVGDAEARQLHDMDSALTVVLTLPDAPKADGRTYAAARSHEGTATRVNCSYANGVLAFDSDRFSAFEVAYQDKEQAKALAKTGDASVAPLAIGALLAAGAVAVILGLRRRRNEA